MHELKSGIRWSVNRVSDARPFFLSLQASNQFKQVLQALGLLISRGVTIFSSQNKLIKSLIFDIVPFFKELFCYVILQPIFILIKRTLLKTSLLTFFMIYIYI